MLSLEQWLTRIEQAHPPFTIELGLDRISQVADRLNLRKFFCPVITVAGTNGKGSCVACLEHIYLAEGYRVGAYTSPHLLVFQERIRLNGEMVSEYSLCEAFAIIEQACGEIHL